MKRLIGLFLIIALMIPAFGQAEALPPDLNLPETVQSAEFQASGLVAYRDGLIATNWDKTLFIKDGKVVAETAGVDLKMTDGESVGFGDLRVDGDKIYLQAGTTLTTLEIKDGQFVGVEKRTITNKNLDGSDRQMDEFNFSQWADIRDGKIYAVVQGMGTDNSLVVTDLNTATAVWQKLPEGFQFASLYKGGKLIFQVLDDRESFDSATGTMKPAMLKVLDPETGKSEDAGKMTTAFSHQAWMTYSEENDSLYYLLGSRIYKHDMKGGNDQLVAYLAADSDMQIRFRRLVILPGLVAASYSASGAEHVSIDPAKLPQGALHVMPMSGSDAAQKAAALALKGVPIVKEESGFFGDDKALAERLMAKSDRLDILSMQIDYNDHRSFIKKGYMLDLSRSEKLKNFVDKCYPSVRDVAYQDGGLYMLPVWMYTTIPTWNETAAEAMGIDKPKTVMEYLDLLRRWPVEYAEKYPEYQLFDGADPREHAINVAWSAYLASYQGQFDKFTLDTPIFKQMMSLIKDMPVKKEEENQPTSGGGMVNIDEMMSQRFLLKNVSGSPRGWTVETTYGDAFGPQANKDKYVPLMLTQEDGSPLKLAMNISFVSVNSQSQNVANAIKYLEALVDNLDKEILVQMQPANNEPVEDPGFEANLARMKKYAEAARNAYDKAEGAEKSQMEEMLKVQENFVAIYEKDGRYMISAEAIKKYRDAMVHNYVITYRQGMAWINTVLKDTLERFKDGQLPLDEFIREADGKLRLAMIEDR